jgi:hypothetical protein
MGPSLPLRSTTVPSSRLAFRTSLGLASLARSSNSFVAPSPSFGVASGPAPLTSATAHTLGSRIGRGRATAPGTVKTTRPVVASRTTDADSTLRTGVRISTKPVTRSRFTIFTPWFAIDTFIQHLPCKPPSANSGWRYSVGAARSVLPCFDSEHDTFPVSETPTAIARIPGSKPLDPRRATTALHMLHIPSTQHGSSSCISPGLHPLRDTGEPQNFSAVGKGSLSWLFGSAHVGLQSLPEVTFAHSHLSLG